MKMNFLNLSRILCCVIIIMSVQNGFSQKSKPIAVKSHPDSLTASQMERFVGEALNECVGCFKLLDIAYDNIEDLDFVILNLDTVIQRERSEKRLLADQLSKKPRYILEHDG